jgi:hypothetical protein
MVLQVSGTGGSKKVHNGVSFMPWGRPETAARLDYFLNQLTMGASDIWWRRHEAGVTTSLPDGRGSDLPLIAGCTR